MGGMSTGYADGTRIEDIDFKRKQAPPPKGCKEYWFNAEGRFYNGDGTRPILKTEVVFYCVASSDKKAREKFDKRK